MKAAQTTTERRRSLVELGEHLAALVPERVRHAVTPYQILRRVYGIEPGWHCTGCGRPYEVEDLTQREDNAGRPMLEAACPGCRKPLPRRCATEGCADVVHPMPGHGRRGATSWYDGGALCVTCTTNEQARTRAAVFAHRVEAKAVAGACAFDMDKPWRAQVVELARMWHQGNRSICAAFIYGDFGCGKTVAAAFLVLGLNKVHGADFWIWTREEQIIDAHRDRFCDDPERASRAIDWLERLRTVPMLVIDEFFKGGFGAYSEKVIELFWDVLSTRLDNHLITVGVSNAPAWIERDQVTCWHKALNHGGDGRRGEGIASRWDGVGEYIRAVGEDRRKMTIAKLKPKLLPDARDFHPGAPVYDEATARHLPPPARGYRPGEDQE